MSEFVSRSLDPDVALRVAQLFRAFSDQSRVKLIYAMLENEANVSDLAQTAGLSESATSHHLQGLRQLRLVRARKTGQQVFYTVDDDHVVAIFTQMVTHVQQHA